MHAAELEDIGFEISVLRTLTDAALDHGPPDGLLVRAVAHVLHDRCTRLEVFVGRSGHKDVA